MFLFFFFFVIGFIVVKACGIFYIVCALWLEPENIRFMDPMFFQWNVSTFSLKSSLSSRPANQLCLWLKEALI